MNTEKNSYTIIYATVMVVVAAVLLAGASVALRDKQQSNERIDKMEQILRSIGKQAEAKTAVPALYAENIKRSLIIDEAGNQLEAFEGAQLASSQDKVFAEDLEEGQYPLYLAELGDLSAYIIPMRGAGLWGPIWGYIAVDARDGSTILGVDLGNQGETPGLGAEMSATFFMERFKGKQLFEDGTFRGISIIKPGTQPEGPHHVDGLSGGTITSNGVSDMLAKSLSPYRLYLENNKVI